MKIRKQNAEAVARSGVRGRLVGNNSATNLTPADRAYKLSEIETVLKRCVIDAYSFDHETAIRLIRAFDLVAA